MAYFHRKILQKSNGTVVFVLKKPCPLDDCDDHQTPQPPPPTPRRVPSPSLSSAHTLSPYLIFMFCGLAISFLFICYLVFVKRYQSRRLRNRELSLETRQDFINENFGPVIDHPIWLINTIGLDQSQIESIHVFKYKKDGSLIEGTDCSVCLSEFEDDESLRLLPKCNHAFHVPCIDTWLRSHKNCPLCRAPIIISTNDQSDHATIESNSIESNTNEETERTPVVGSETINANHHVVEVENNGETEKSYGIVNETGARVHSDLVDQRRVQGVDLSAMRRSFSNSQLVLSKKASNAPKSVHKLKGSSSSIQIRGKLMKSSSFGHSSQKASNLMNNNPHNRSY